MSEDKMQRFQAREAFNLDGRPMAAGEVFFLHPAEGALYFARGQVLKLADNAQPEAPPAPSKPRRPRSAAELETKAPSKPRGRPRKKAAVEPLEEQGEMLEEQGEMLEEQSADEGADEGDPAEKLEAD